MRWLEVRSHLAAVCDKHVFRADAQAEDLGCAVAEVDRLRAEPCGGQRLVAFCKVMFVSQTSVMMMVPVTI